MTTRRRYTKAQKAAAVTTAEMTSTLAAAEATGIPRKTIAYWLEAPEFATLRQKTRDDIAQGMATIVHLAQTRIVAELEAGNFQPHDLVVLLGVATDKAQLLSGQATNRTETSIAGGLSDERRRELRDYLDSLPSDPIEVAPQ